MSRATGPGARTATGRGRLLRDLLLVHVPVAVLLGVAWWSLAPRLDYRVFDGRPFSVDETAYTQIVAGDGWFVVLGALAGAGCASVLLLRGHRGVGLTLGLAAGGLLGSLLAWGIGVLLGPGTLDALVAAAEEGATVTAGPELQAYGALLVWPIVAVAIAFVAAWFGGPVGGPGSGPGSGPVSGPEPRSEPASPG